jgi:DNA modification methylase
MLGRPQRRIKSPLPGRAQPVDDLAGTEPQDDHGRIRRAQVDHPTQKPVALYEAPIGNHLRRGEPVYDPFLGSGTALIAAERLGRRCYAMEIDPRYVQVAIERWQLFTGEEAVKLDG